MTQEMGRRKFLQAAAGAGALGLAGRSSGAASRMFVSLNSALTPGAAGWPGFARLAAKTGYGGADLTNLNAAMKDGAAETRALLSELKLRLSAAGLPLRLTGDEAAFKSGLETLSEAAEFLARIDCPRMTTVVPSGSQTPKAELRKILKDRLSAVGEVLARSKVRLGLEFLGPLQLRARAPHEFIWRMDEMLEFAKECGPNIGLLLDSWHWHHAGATVADILAAGRPRIVHVHVSDSAKLPPEQVIDNQRLLPGDGVIDLTAFFRALQKIGYEDGISPEVLGRIPKDMPPEEGARLGLESTLKVMRKAGVAA